MSTETTFVPAPGRNHQATWFRASVALVVTATSAGEHPRSWAPASRASSYARASVSSSNPTVPRPPTVRSNSWTVRRTDSGTSEIDAAFRYVSSSAAGKWIGGRAIRPSASGYSSAATPAFAEAGERSTGRGTFGAAHAFPIRERCLLGSSTRQKVVPSNSGIRVAGAPSVSAGDLGIAPPRSPASPEALPASRSLRPLGTGANSSDEHSTCQRGDAGWAASRSERCRR